MCSTSSMYYFIFIAWKRWRWRTYMISRLATNILLWLSHVIKYHHAFGRWRWVLHRAIQIRYVGSDGYRSPHKPMAFCYRFQSDFILLCKFRFVPLLTISISGITKTHRLGIEDWWSCCRFAQRLLTSTFSARGDHLGLPFFQPSPVVTGGRAYPLSPSH